MSERLIKQLREQRMSWIDLDPAPQAIPVGEPAPVRKRVRLIRPPEREIFTSLYKAGTVLVGFDEACRYVVDWSGFTEADVLGAAVGSADPVPFSAELWAALASDNIEWSQRVQQALLDVVMAYLKKTQADQKN